MKDEQIATMEKEVMDKENEVNSKKEEIARLDSCIQEQQNINQTLRSQMEVPNNYIMHP